MGCGYGGKINNKPNDNLELERLNMFPDNHTYIEGVTPTKRAFFMGNALVVGIIEKLGTELMDRVKITTK